jgi:DNA-binding GntR family transcriptional regulator
MQYLKINKLSTQPLYRQLSESIELAIVKKVLRDGDQLPSERDICRIFEVSSKVVRRAFDELSAKGLTEGIAGRGTFVKTRLKIRAKLGHHYQVSDALRAQGHEVRVSTTYVTMMEFDRTVISPVYDLPEVNYLRIRRLYLVNQLPYLSRILYIPESRIQSPKITVDNKLSCLAMIESLTGSKAKRIKADIHTFVAATNEAIILQLQENELIQFFLTFIYDNNDELLGVMHSYFNAKLMEWSVTSDDELHI